VSTLISAARGAEPVDLQTAPSDDRTGLFCLECKRYLKNDETIPRVHCAKCGKANLRLFLLPADLALINATTVAQVTSRSWWHFTTRASWPPAENKLVHLGSLPAAIARVSNGQHKLEPPHLNGTAVTALYFHKVSISSTELLTEVTVEGQSSTIREDEALSSGQLLRYVNFYEAPGSVSLLLRSSDVEVVDTIPIPVTRGDISTLRWLTRY